MGYAIPFFSTHKIEFFTKAPGGFLVFGVMIAIVNKITSGKAPKRKSFDGCEACPSAAFCMGSCSDNKEKEGV